jgi:23S rRNA (cytidine1920-2'-O)/16S rRNA (cytidine1409-2'-O)-methyltransferase
LTRRRRLDVELVRRGLAASRTEAAGQVEHGRVLVNGARADKAARQVDPGDAVVVEGPPPKYVSRGGLKLEGALDHFAIDVRGRRALDAGASTGGFTDCLLQRGAAHVVALDVGHSQLHERIRRDDRVTVIERFNVRNLSPADIGGPVDIVVADLSFISLRLVLPALVGAAEPGADLVLLVKPQFEATRQEASRGKGIITDPTVHERVLTEVAASVEAAGGDVLGTTDSPITGGDGNREFLMHVRRRGS